VWQGAQQVLREYLEGISVAELADRQGLVASLADINRNQAARP
jgi:hypothetical protein